MKEDKTDRLPLNMGFVSPIWTQYSPLCAWFLVYGFCPQRTLSEDWLAPGLAVQVYRDCRTDTLSVDTLNQESSKL